VEMSFKKYAIEMQERRKKEWQGKKRLMMDL
jgi:hypothetical protein